MTAMQRFYQTKDPGTFAGEEGQDTMNEEFAAWAINHRDREPKPIPCTVRNQQNSIAGPWCHTLDFARKPYQTSGWLCGVTKVGGGYAVARRWVEPGLTR